MSRSIKLGLVTLLALGIIQTGIAADKAPSSDKDKSNAALKYNKDKKNQGYLDTSKKSAKGKPAKK